MRKNLLAKGMTVSRHKDIGMRDYFVLVLAGRIVMREPSELGRFRPGVHQAGSKETKDCLNGSN
jgi:hypothetical protein